MKIGFWNRLAIVAAVVATVGGSTWFVLSERARAWTDQLDGYKACLKRGGPVEGDCFNIWLNDPKVYWGWREWFEGLVIFAVLSLALYLAIWACVVTAKWVWQGRQTHE